MTGGYEDGYHACECFWGTSPGSYVIKLVEMLGNVQGLAVLDAGCGEGKNSEYLADLGAQVLAIDVSHKAITNARARWTSRGSVRYVVGDVRSVRAGSFDVVIAYGMLHCLGSERELRDVIERLQKVTRPGGHHVACIFNDRHQDLAAAHPGFSPLLLPHDWYLDAYRGSGWELLDASDTDLRESHPHNRVEHVHSMTRLIARRSA